MKIPLSFFLLLNCSKFSRFFFFCWLLVLWIIHVQFIPHPVSPKISASVIKPVCDLPSFVLRTSYCFVAALLVISLFGII